MGCTATLLDTCKKAIYPTQREYSANGSLGYLHNQEHGESLGKGYPPPNMGGSSLSGIGHPAHLFKWQGEPSWVSEPFPIKHLQSGFLLRRRHLQIDQLLIWATSRQPLVEPTPTWYRQSKTLCVFLSRSRSMWLWLNKNVPKMAPR